MAMPGLCCCAGFSLLVSTGDCPLVAVGGPPIAVASLVAHRLYACRLHGRGTWAQELWSRAREPRFSSCGILSQLLCCTWDLPGSGIEPESPTLAGRFFTTEPPGKPWGVFLLTVTVQCCSGCPARTRKRKKEEQKKKRDSWGVK